jgi:hypothetical protein
VSEQYQTITIDLDRQSKDGSIAVDGVKVKKTFGTTLSSASGVVLSSELGHGNHLRIESLATVQTIRAVIAMLEGLVEGIIDPDALRCWRGGLTIEGYPLTDLDSVSLTISRNDVVRLVVVKQVEELDLTLHGQREGRS